MTAAGGSRLYTPEVLALAVSLAQYPPGPDLPLRGSARSRACGSTLDLGLRLDGGQRIAGLGLEVKACAIGQAAAALFASAAQGRAASDIDAAHDALVAWLSGEGPMPEWPGLAVLEQAQAYPARHGAILLPWKAAQAALGKANTTG